MKVEVQNCTEKESFEVNIEIPFFPISGSGIVCQEWCRKETRDYPEGYARLYTDSNRQILYCHNKGCKNCN